MRGQGGTMSMLASSTAANISRRAFRNLIALWLLFMAATVLIILMFGTSRALAMEPLPFPKIVRETAPAEFVQFSKVPSQSLVADRCQSLLNTVHQDKRSYKADSSSRRPAGSTSPNMVHIQAIKAYRQCMSQSALQELAAWRWSR